LLLFYHHPVSGRLNSALRTRSQQSKGGSMKQKYETVVIFDGTLPDETIKKENVKIEDFFKSNGEFEKTDVWGKRQLAYTIKKKKSGVYHVYYYETESQKNISNLVNKLLELDENVLRHQTVIRLIQKESARKPIIDEPGSIPNGEEV
jgi:small subunit ribosomal protein S6